MKNKKYVTCGVVLGLFIVGLTVFLMRKKCICGKEECFECEEWQEYCGY